MMLCAALAADLDAELDRVTDDTDRVKALIADHESALASRLGAPAPLARMVADNLERKRLKGQRLPLCFTTKLLKPVLKSHA